MNLRTCWRPVIPLFLLFSSALHAGGNCSAPTTGLPPLTDLGAGFYLGMQGGLYPGGVNTRSAAHDIAADEVARVVMRGVTGTPDAVNGRAVLLTIGMSNTNAESQAFIQIATADPARNNRIVLVNGAQGGWPAAEVADPNTNGPYWLTVDQRLTAAGVTGPQVQAVWIKQAEARPTEPFPQDATRLQSDLAAIVRILTDRYPNVRQVYLSSRIYAGYATTTLNPEPFAHQSGFSSKWLIQDQLNGDLSLNFDPRRGPVEAGWMSWGPYLWADGTSARGDGLTWVCDELANDGTHPSTLGAQKVGQMLHGFLGSDPVSSRWYMDCAPADTGAFSRPPRVLDLDVTIDSQTSAPLLRWTGLGPAAGAGTLHDIVSGSLASLRQTGFTQAVCAASGVTAAAISDPLPEPAPGQGVWYLARGRNSCGAGTFGEPDAADGPRDLLDQTSICTGI